MNDFKFIKRTYGVPADMHREVIMNGRKGVITKDMDTYLGITFYDDDTKTPSPCHPTWEMEYLDTFNQKPPKPSRSRQRYLDYLNVADCFESFGDYLKYLKTKNKTT